MIKGFIILNAVKQPESLYLSVDVSPFDASVDEVPMRERYDMSPLQQISTEQAAFVVAIFQLATLVLEQG